MWQSYFPLSQSTLAHEVLAICLIQTFSEIESEVEIGEAGSLRIQIPLYLERADKGRGNHNIITIQNNYITIITIAIHGALCFQHCPPIFEY